MPGEYAASTNVSTDRSFSEIKNTIRRFGASGFGYIEQGLIVGIAFEVNGLQVRMTMTLPDRKLFEVSPTGRWRSEATIEKEWEQACRQRWRTLANGIKAKLAMVDDGISTVEREFLANIVLPDGDTVADRIVPEIREIVRSGTIPSMMPGIPAPARIIALGNGS